jgi:hypothetical protein
LRPIRGQQCDIVAASSSRQQEGRAYEQQAAFAAKYRILVAEEVNRK